MTPSSRAVCYYYFIEHLLFLKGELFFGGLFTELIRCRKSFDICVFLLAFPPRTLSVAVAFSPLNGNKQEK